MAPVIAASVDDAIGALLDDLAEPASVVTPSAAAVSAVVRAGSGDGAPPLRVLAPEAALKDATADLLVAGRAADLIADERLALRATTGTPTSQLVVTGTAVIALVTVDDAMFALPTERTDYVEVADDWYTDAWERADAFSPRTPPLSRVRGTLRETFGAGFVDDFDAILASRDAITGEDGPGIVELCLLLAAYHEELLYDVSRWGEDVGLASKATFSRTKTGLEEAGLIATEKVPIEVGRPRLRLTLADDRLREASAGELADVTERLVG